MSNWKQSDFNPLKLWMWKSLCLRIYYNLFIEKDKRYKMPLWTDYSEQEGEMKDENDKN